MCDPRRPSCTAALLQNPQPLSESPSLLSDSMTDSPSTTAECSSTVKDSDNNTPPVKLLDLSQVDRLFPVATGAAVSVWIVLLALVYSLVPTEDLVYLEGAPREAAVCACSIFLVTTGVSLIPFISRSWNSNNNNGPKMSGILKALLVVQFIAGCTNALLAFCPTVVVVDPFTKSRVYLVRWCEWIPLSGLMTFITEIVDCHNGMTGILIPVLVALSQSFSCLCALVLPYCPNWASWLVVMAISCLLWLAIFPRLYHKWQVYKNSRKGISMNQMEQNCRFRFAFHLLAVCTTLWSILVALYFVNMAAFYYLPNSPLVQNQSLPMILDTLFDVTAKVLYMRLISNVHETVFDPEGRARRQLHDLKKMISILWEASSDVIVISVQEDRSISTMISPAFSAMIGAADATDKEEHRKALMVKSLVVPQSPADRINLKSTSSFVDASEIPYYASGDATATTAHESTTDGEIHHLLNEHAGALVQAAWNGLQKKVSKAEEDALVVLDLCKADGSLIKCEIKLSQHANSAVIAVVRDVTERYMRFEAEQRAHQEYLARQKDVQTVNRFTRHEIKNGLLASIELCQEAAKLVSREKGNHTTNQLRRTSSSGSLFEIQAGDYAAAGQQEREEGNTTNNQLCNASSSGSLFEIQARDAAAGQQEQQQPTSTHCMAQLDQTLHEVLDTILAEAMAREIVHESYQPRLDRVDISSKLRDEAANQRFPVHICPPDTPPLLMDPQLLKYIHRNAVSNACKYGRKGGRVMTEVHYLDKKGEFEMDVINDPGPYHDVLVSMGANASSMVFAQGKRLKIHQQNEDETENQLSSGDGAWIMQRCAKALGGECTIRFDPHQTVFSFRCKVKPYTLPWKDHEDFQVPPGTWGIAYDDSNIQRKLMKRIFTYAGVEEDKIIVKGKHENDIKGFEDLLRQTLTQNPQSFILVLMDENLDYEPGDKRKSGSKHAEIAYKRLSRAEQDRVFLLVRSANDADSDIAIYNKRTHGFFPKTTIQKERVKALLAPAWLQRFATQPLGKNPTSANDAVPETITTQAMVDNTVGFLGTSGAEDNEGARTGDATKSLPEQDAEARHGARGVDRSGSDTTEKCSEGDSDEEVKEEGSGRACSMDDSSSRLLLNDSQNRQTLGVTLEDEVWATAMKIDKMIIGDEESDWDAIWSKLHTLKGDLPALGDAKNITWSVSLIEGLRGDERPKVLKLRWDEIYRRVLEEVK